jgi:hypothetical protein
LQKIQTQGLTLYKFNHLLGHSSLIHCVTARPGGVSAGSYALLNLGFKSGDNQQNVVTNRRRVCEALGIKIDTLTLGQQVHGSTIRVVTQDDRGRGALDIKSAFPGIDALITQAEDIALMAQSADCPLIIGYAPDKKVITVIHASWRSMSQGIIPQTIKLMNQQFGIAPAGILAGVSPSIGPCCYEVKDDFIKAMQAYTKRAGDFIRLRQEKTYFDLWAMARNELIKSGLKPEHIEVAGMCTSCQPDLFYSYRRDGSKTGRFGALIYQK